MSILILARCYQKQGNRPDKMVCGKKRSSSTVGKQLVARIDIVMKVDDVMERMILSKLMGAGGKCEAPYMRKEFTVKCFSRDSDLRLGALSAVYQWKAYLMMYWSRPGPLQDRGDPGFMA